MGNLTNAMMQSIVTIWWGTISIVLFVLMILAIHQVYIVAKKEKFLRNFLIVSFIVFILLTILFYIKPSFGLW
jgi:hypothetical protein